MSNTGAQRIAHPARAGKHRVLTVLRDPGDLRARAWDHPARAVHATIYLGKRRAQRGVSVLRRSDRDIVNGTIDHHTPIKPPMISIATSQ